MNARKLRLHRETLTELTPVELTGVNAGSHLCGVTDNCTHASLDASCPTLPITDCVAVDTGAVSRRVC